MAQYISKTQHYQRVQKPLLERQRRARINKCLDALKQMMAEFQSDDAILRMDKAEMLETTIAFMRKRQRCATSATSVTATASVDVDSYKHGYMNAVNEVSRVLASIPGMSVDLGKSVMSHLGRVYNRLQQEQQQQKQQQIQPLTINCCTTSSMAPLSPASSGYHSDYDSPAVSPVAVNLSSNAEKNVALWRPW